MGSTRPADGTARTDLYDPANPQVTLTLDAETAFKLRKFLRESNLGEHTEGGDDTLFHKVYRPLLEVEKAIRQGMEAHAYKLRRRSEEDRVAALRFEALANGLYDGPS